MNVLLIGAYFAWGLLGLLTVGMVGYTLTWLVGLNKDDDAPQIGVGGTIMGVIWGLFSLVFNALT